MVANAPGSPPGLVRVHPNAVPSTLNVMAFGPDDLLHETDVPLDWLISMRQDQPTAWPVLWVDIVGLGSGDVLKGIGELFGLHPLVLEDILHVAQRPKLEEYNDYNFIVMRMVPDPSVPDTEQLAIVQFDNCVLTFQERPGDSLQPVRERIQRNVGRVRSSQADYLTYAIIDAVVDHYAPLLEVLGQRIEQIEHKILSEPATALLAEAYDLKHEILALRRALLPMRDAIGQLHREEVPRFSPEIDPYLRDCFDHALRLIENLDVIREAASGLTDLYMSSVSYHMNEVMKVLTIISTIFIPLSFIVGLYGMNFDQSSPYNMPELGMRYGYLVIVGIMASITLGLLFYFRRKGWMRPDDLALWLRRHW